MLFSHIRLENWRNFQEVDVPLAYRAFLIGPNASGKSNILDAFRFLRDIVTPGGGFEASVNTRGGVSRIRNLAARRQPDVVVDVKLQEQDQPGNWRYRLGFGQDPQRRPILRQEQVWHYDGSLLLDRPDDDDKKDRERLRQTHLEQTFANQQFREIAEFFASIDYSHIVPQLIRDPDRYISRTVDPFGGDFLERIASANQKVRESRLQRIEAALRVAVPQLTKLELTKDVRGVPHLRGNYKHWRPQGAWQTEADFSDGTLRLLGLLWALMEGKGPLLLEEPELSLHPGVVRYLPQMMNNIQHSRKPAVERQVILSTHSPNLLSDNSIGIDEIFLFKVSDIGTEVVAGFEVPNIREEIEAGLSMAEIAIPRTEPPDVYQLALFGE